MYHINIVEFLAEIPDKCLSTVAVKDEERELTFGQLQNAVVAYAHSLQSLFENHVNEVVGVLMPKGIETVIADLAILLSGNAYMNLDPKNPAERLRVISDHCKLAYVISDLPCADDLIGTATHLIAPPNLTHNAEHSDICCFNYRKLIDTDPLCVINTSGSTGIPKSVLLSHRGMIDFIEEVRAEKLLNGPETIGSLSPAFFDIYAFELCQMLAFGSTLVILPESLAAFPLKLLERARDAGVSYIFWVPTIMVNIANSDLLAYVSLPDLKKVWFAGEVFPTSKYNYWASHLSGAEFVNLYGPIEISVDCLFYRVRGNLPEDEPIPIGKPFRNTGVVLLRDDGTPAADLHEEGELCIRGSSLAHGYFNDPDKTAKVFIQNPLNSSYPELIYRTGDYVRLGADGNFRFLGRRDTLVKRMGYRIELSEIEHIAVDRLKLFGNCCAVYHPETKDLTLFYEGANGLSQGEIKKALLSQMPRYMVPNHFVKLDSMPRNPNGKIDRRSLQSAEVGQ
jgi:amino acid adenylation domain-containing protein